MWRVVPGELFNGLSIALQHAIPVACLRDQKAANLLCSSGFESTPLFSAPPTPTPPRNPAAVERQTPTLQHIETLTLEFTDTQLSSSTLSGLCSSETSVVLSAKTALNPKHNSHSFQQCRATMNPLNHSGNCMYHLIVCAFMSLVGRTLTVDERRQGKCIVLIVES
jgi:hypothetical protein